MPSVGDEVTDAVIEQCGTAITENRHVSFLYEIAEGVFVLRYHLRYTRNVGINNLEIKGDAHIRRLEEHDKRKPPVGGYCVFRQRYLCCLLDADTADRGPVL